jgi:hypothetical protein
MMEISRTKIDTPQGFTRSVIYGHDKVTFDVRDGREIAYADLTHEQARAYAEWILENVPEPPVQTAREFILTLTPGTLIRRINTGSEFVVLNGHRIMRTKLSTTAYMKPVNQVGDSWPIDHKFHNEPNPYEVIE